MEEVAWEASGYVLLLTSVALLTIRYVAPIEADAQRRAIRLLQWPFGASAYVYCWFSPWHGRGTNAYHIIVFIGLGVGLVILADSFVSRRRGQRDRSN